MTKSEEDEERSSQRSITIPLEDKKAHTSLCEWMEDGVSSRCFVCDIHFDRKVRRHHCRCCGVLLCGECCCFEEKIPGSEGARRVCKNCVSIIREENVYVDEILPLLHGGQNFQEKVKYSLAHKTVHMQLLHTNKCLLLERSRSDLVEIFVRDIQNVLPVTFKSFRIVTRNKRDILLRCDTEQSQHDWIAALKLLVARQNTPSFKDRVLSQRHIVVDSYRSRRSKTP